MRDKKTGTIYKLKNSKFYWIAYWSGGKREFESSKSTRKSDAVALLTSRTGDINRGIVVTPKLGRLTLGDGLTNVINKLKQDGRESVAHAQRQIDKHILQYFKPERLMNSIATSHLSAYVTHRHEQGASAASVNHELATIRRAFKLAVLGQELMTSPHIPMLALNNARKGFFERHEFEAVRAALPTWFQPIVTFAFITGWRVKSEILPLTVDRVDLQVGVVTLAPGTTKNKEGRSFYLTRELRAVLEAQVADLGRLKEAGVISPYVFHYPNGSRIKDLKASWKKACETAGHPGKMLHDFRRSAIRTFERSGVPRSTAKSLVGHKTDSVYARYAIVDSAMQKEAAAKLDTWVDEQQRPTGQVKRFARKS